MPSCEMYNSYMPPWFEVFPVRPGRTRPAMSNPLRYVTSARRSLTRPPTHPECGLMGFRTRAANVSGLESLRQSRTDRAYRPGPPPTIQDRSHHAVQEHSFGPRIGRDTPPDRGYIRLCNAESFEGRVGWGSRVGTCVGTFLWGTLPALRPQSRPHGCWVSQHHEIIP